MMRLKKTPKNKLVLFIIIIFFVIGLGSVIGDRSQTEQDQNSAESVSAKGKTMAPSVEVDGPKKAKASITLLAENGGRIDWSPNGKLIAFDRRGNDGFYDIYTMDTNGSSVVCVSCNTSGLGNLNNGNPAWHPNGNFIAFQSQTRRSMISQSLTDPGKGLNNNLWVMKSDGSQAWSLTDLNRTVYGILHPHFSHNGDKIVWAELQSPKIWAIKVADFEVKNGVPSLKNIKTYQPGETARFYETHGFSKNDREIIFSANPTNMHGEFGFDIYTLDLRNQKLTALTNTPNIWDEHAQLSPNGKRIVWSKNTSPNQIKLELFIMNNDGTRQKQLTNLLNNNNPDFLGHNAAGIADSSWNPNGKEIVFYAITDQSETGGKIYKMKID